MGEMPMQRYVKISGPGKSRYVRNGLSLCRAAGGVGNDRLALR
jgi:hypothetical protein